MATVNCPKCNGKLDVMTDDLRGEWERITYYCEECNREYDRLITFKEQSGMIKSDEWELEDEVFNTNGHLRCPNKIYSTWQEVADFWYDQAYKRGVKIDENRLEIAKLKGETEERITTNGLLATNKNLRQALEAAIGTVGELDEENADLKQQLKESDEWVFHIRAVAQEQTRKGVEGDEIVKQIIAMCG